ncbi:hypothetical protein SAMN05444339_12314 [Loktanella atrilutea]|uniref:Uncharacterized protein n=1 Tax=Loktanella atrilutea TaxID=366533 RepID=A0A1M5FPB4_LOKAT|nr:hypothetical protein [Loktanella atrilutea]SHF93264.1 hypothetical protein SAMN05444339_12314 [Loktanella atrilutea]
MTFLKILLSGLAIALPGTAAFAHIPSLNASCPGGIEFHADEGGPVYINGEEAKVTVSNGEYIEASHKGTMISITVGDDGSASVSYTASGGANGICTVNDSFFGRMETCPVDVTEADRYRYPACN